MTALAILSVASTPETGRGLIASDGDADAFAKALTDADAAVTAIATATATATATAPAKSARPTITITRDNAIRGEEVALEPEAANTNEAIVLLPVQPLAVPPAYVAPPVVSSPIDGETTVSDTAKNTGAPVVADAGQYSQASISSDALPSPDAFRAAITDKTEAVLSKVAEPPSQSAPPAPVPADDIATQAATAAPIAATDVALLPLPGNDVPSIVGFAPPPLPPREIIDRALRATAQAEAKSTDDQTSDTDDTSADAIGEKPVSAQTTVKGTGMGAASVARAVAETPQPVDVASVSASTAEDSTDTGTATASPASTTETHTVSAKDLTLSTVARATIETTAQLSAQIVRKLEGRYTRFELALTPEGLGRVDVSLDIDSDGQLAARLAFDNPLAATDLRDRADELRRQLEDAGFRIAQDGLDFTDRDPSSGGRFDRRQDQGRDGNRAFAGASRLAASADAALSTPPRWINLNLTPRGVDMKV